MEALEQGKRRREIMAAAAAAASSQPRAPPGLSPLAAPVVNKRIRSKLTPLPATQKTPSTMTPDPKTARIEVASTKKRLSFGHLVASLILIFKDRLVPYIPQVGLVCLVL